MVAQVTVGIQLCRSFLGERLAGTIGLVSDLIAEGARASFLDRLPGHPEQAEDATNQSGSDAGLFRYRLETLASWKSRVGNPWPVHEQAGTDINLLREIDTWGLIMYPATWVAGQCYLLESQWARFALFVPAGLLPWTLPGTYGGGLRYGEGSLYGITANSEDVATLRRIVRKWKPSRSKARGVIVFSGHVYGQHGITYGGGSTYGGSGIRFDF
jgi:hypothetical protein